MSNEDDATHGVTLYELARNLERWRSETHIEVVELGHKIDGLAFVRPDLYEANRVADARLTAAQDDRLLRLEERVQWGARALALMMLGVVANIMGGVALYMVTK